MYKKVLRILLAFLPLLVFQLQVEASSQLLVNQENVKLKGYLKKDYKAYSFKIRNDLASDIKISKVEFTGDRASDLASNAALENSGNEVAVLWAFGISLFWLFLIPTMIALVATPFILIAKGSKKKTTRKESYMLGEKGPREVKIAVADSGEIVALFPKDMTSTSLSFTYQNLKTGALTTFEKKFEI